MLRRFGGTNMASYDFNAISTAQALAWTSADKISVKQGTAAATTVIFNDNQTISVTIEGSTVIFGSGFSQTGVASSTIAYPDQSTLIVGNASNNIIALTPPSAIPSGAAYGGAGDDRFDGFGNWLIQGNQGNDYMYLKGGANTVYGGQDNDSITFAQPFAAQIGNFAQGNKGDDSIVGSFKADTILGGQGNDTLIGGDGGDFVNGNLGNDVVSGDGTLLGEGGDDTLSSTFAATATLRGGDGNDQITIGGGSGFGGTSGGPGAAGGFASGDNGDDTMSCSTGADTLMGGNGNDMISGVPGSSATTDLMDGEAGDDTISARDGANLIKGGLGLDKLTGGTGADTLDGGAGTDILTGGGGADVFVFVDATGTPSVSSLDRITDWGSDDKIQLRMLGAVGYSEVTAADYATAESMATAKLASGTAEVIAIQVGADVVIFADGSAANTVFSVTALVGRTLNDIAAGNFL